MNFLGDPVAIAPRYKVWSVFVVFGTTRSAVVVPLGAAVAFAVMVISSLLQAPFVKSSEYKR